MNLTMIPTDDEDLICYSQMYSSRAQVLTPSNADELALILADAAERGRRVTLRAGGNAFDGQSLGSEMVVSMARLDTIGAPFAEGDDWCITVGAGATWGKILDAVAPHGLVPAIMVTTEKATAGGTLSGNCLSRFSPSFGKEGGWVRRFELLTMTGERLTCTPPDPEQPEDTWTLEERAFMSAIGGLGYLGAVYEITYKLVRAYHPTGDPKQSLAVQTTLEKYTTYDRLAESLCRQAHEMCTTDVPEGMTLAEFNANQAIYSGLVRRVNGKQSAVVFASTYTTTAKRNEMPIHQPKSAFRFISEMLLRTRLDWWLTLFAFHILFRRRTTYIDDLRGFTFFMDGNSRCKAWGKRHGMKMPTVQQTFVIPFTPEEDFGSPEEAAEARSKKLATWLDESHQVLQRHGVRPSFSDVLFIRDTLAFGLSSTAGRAGFAVSYAFERSDEKFLGRVEQALSELADKLCEERFDGRVYLVKNVYASQAALRKMYGEHAIGLFKLKRRLDPDALLANDFLERTFGDLGDEVYLGLHGADESVSVAVSA